MRQCARHCPHAAIPKGLVSALMALYSIICRLQHLITGVAGMVACDLCGSQSSDALHNQDNKCFF